MAEKIDRLTRINELLKRELAQLIERGSVCIPSGMLVSVTKVNTSVDLRNATVYISMFGGKASQREQAMNELHRARPAFQREVAQKLGFKHTPVLTYKEDNSAEKGDRVLAILNGTDPDAN
jgi:ribosome-binding factor A